MQLNHREKLRVGQDKAGDIKNRGTETESQIEKKEDRRWSQSNLLRLLVKDRPAPLSLELVDDVLESFMGELWMFELVVNDLFQLGVTVGQSVLYKLVRAHVRR